MSTGTQTNRDREQSLDAILLNILQQEFPDDIFYSQGNLTPNDPGSQARTAGSSDADSVPVRDIEFSERNSRSVLTINSSEDTYAPYDIARSVPTVDIVEVDEIIDEEFEFYTTEEEPVTEPNLETGLFLVERLSRTADWHDLYINNGPHTLQSEYEDPASNLFCVYFINAGRAYAIPTYKTLEVMLVEQGLTYDAITEASADQKTLYDLTLSDVVSSNPGSPFATFAARSLPSRDQEWNRSIRFRSNYRPVAPFKRDPGDYIKPQSMRFIQDNTPVDENGIPIEPDRYSNVDPNDRYFDLVFQGQTHKEKLRTEYEGKMVIADWPAEEDFTRERILNTPDFDPDDAVFNLRMMINGHWKIVTRKNTIKLYAYINGYDISRFVAEPYPDGTYGRRGLIQLLINAGGISLIQSNLNSLTGNFNQPINDAQVGNSDLRIGRDPLWNAFPHIVDFDDDDIVTLDVDEYREYLDHFSNNNDMWSKEELQPYEPPGSIKYYPRAQYASLAQQALGVLVAQQPFGAQDEFDESALAAIRDEILELMPDIISEVQLLNTQLGSVYSTMGEYLSDLLGPNGPVYNIWTTNVPWRPGGYYIWERRTDSDGPASNYRQNTSLPELIKESPEIVDHLNDDDLQTIADYQWMKSVSAAKMEEWASNGISGIPAGPGATRHQLMLNSLDITLNSIVSVINFGNNIPELNGVAISTQGPTFGANIGEINVVPNINTFGSEYSNSDIFANLSFIPDNEYIHPGWLLLAGTSNQRNDYLYACIANNIIDQVEGFKQAADTADASLDYIRNAVAEFASQLQNINQAFAVAEANRSVEGLQVILNYILSLRLMVDNFNIGILDQIAATRTEIELFTRDQIMRQYHAIQFVREQAFNEVSVDSTYTWGIRWPNTVIEQISQYIPGLSYSQYLP